MLFSILKDMIRHQGALTVEQYMQIVLQYPEHGYYRRGNPIGSAGDFHTAPEVSQMYGEMVGLWCLEMWQALGKPDPFILLELGPGLGTLINDLLFFTSSALDFHKAMHLVLMESNETLRAIQRKKLGTCTPFYLDNVVRLDPLPLFVIANEFFDNLPIRQFVKTEKGWTERLVDCQNEKLVFANGPAVSSLSGDNAMTALRDSKTGWVHEASPTSLKMMRSITAHIAHYGGAGLVIDYGYENASGASTLEGWHRLAPVDIFAAPGDTDVTADVDFAALCRVVDEQPALISNLVGKGDFLRSQGIISRANVLKKQVSADMAANIDAATHQLVSPSKMGSVWKAMTIKMRL